MVGIPLRDCGRCVFSKFLKTESMPWVWFGENHFSRAYFFRTSINPFYDQSANKANSIKLIGVGSNVSREVCGPSFIREKLVTCLKLKVN